MKKLTATELNSEYKEAKDNFMYFYKGECDKAYKLFASSTADRAKYLEKINGTNETWQSNVFMPYIFSYVKQYLQKTIGVAPDYTVQGNNQDALHEALDKIWQYRMVAQQIDHFLQCFIFGWSYGKDMITKEVKYKITKSMKSVKGTDKKKFTKSIKEDGFVVWPDFSTMNVYNTYRHPRMLRLSDDLPIFHRNIMSYDQLKEMYPDEMEDEKLINKLTDVNGKPTSKGDLTEYDYVRKEVLREVVTTMKSPTTESAFGNSGYGGQTGDQPSTENGALYEVVERIMNHQLTVFIPNVNGAIVIKEGCNPYDHEQKNIEIISFFPRPFMMEGMGIPSILKHLNELVNSDTNKIEDAVSIRVNGMIIASPTALPGYNQQKSIMIKPMGILWTTDTAGVKFAQFPDINNGSFVQLDKIKEMMRTVSGIDEFSSLSPEAKQTATVATFMRESTIEGVKLFLFMQKNALGGHLDHWISYIQQFWTRRSLVPKEILAVLDDYSDTDFPVLQEDWMNDEGYCKLFEGYYETSVDQASTLASSNELKTQKDLALWEKIKDLPDYYIDPETGKKMSIKKFKVLLKILEDYGWDKKQYSSEMKEGVLEQASMGAETIPSAGAEVGAVVEEVPALTEKPVGIMPIAPKLTAALG